MKIHGSPWILDSPTRIDNRERFDTHAAARGNCCAFFWPFAPFADGTVLASALHRTDRREQQNRRWDVEKHT
jgi:hypothetical protein